MRPRAVPIVALDYSSAAAALALTKQLGDRCSFYKIGSELFTAAGPDIVRQVRDQGADVFLDLKFHDIPNTVAGAVRSAVELGARLITVHASGGSAMLAAAVRSAGDQSRVGILGVTVLTSLTGAEVAESWGRPEVDPAAEVLRLAGMVAGAGAHGIVCSGQEAEAVRARFGDRLALLIPGVRPAGEATQDQARVVTPTRAVQAGASYIILGRAVTAAADAAGAMERINAEMAAAES
ncbi:MAG TPA: orotidine-5'-phosphate decarboxylase [Gemmatimonadaceae bacterium]|nr:orotidine-5'-phosphate decarboxylase [Gemmatimonadaceae bacterium]